jgi:hypothetical protein
MELKDALLNLNLLIQVRSIPVEERQMLGHKDIAKCAPTVDFGHLRMFSTIEHQLHYWGRPILNNSNVANFFIILEVNLFIWSLFLLVLVKWKRVSE